MISVSWTSWRSGYRKGTVIVTSQVDPRGWIKLFEDPVIAEAIVDRLINLTIPL